MPANPYVPPSAHVEDERPRFGADAFVASGRARPLGHFWKWIADSWSLYKSQAGMWIVTIILAFGFGIGAAMIGAQLGQSGAGPILSMIINLGVNLLSPVIAVGFFVMADATRRGEPVGIGMLFAGFRHRFGALLLLGLLYLALGFGLGLVIALVAGIVIATGVVAADAFTPGMFGALTWAMLTVAVILIWAIILSATIFAPALVYFHNCSPIEAIKASFLGGMKNFFPGLVCSIVFLVLMLLSMIPLLLGLLITMPMGIILVYIAYRDIYVESAAAV